jgi:ATP synthase F1 delta subunit
MSLAVRRYSEALLDIAFEENCEDEVYEQFGALYAEMKADKDFKRLMTEKILSSEELKATVSKILDGGNSYLISFLMTLIDRNRMEEVMDMFLDFERGYKEKKNILEAEAVTAIEMTEEQIADVKKLSAKNTARKSCSKPRWILRSSAEWYFMSATRCSTLP